MKKVALLACIMYVQLGDIIITSQLNEACLLVGFTFTLDTAKFSHLHSHSLVHIQCVTIKWSQDMNFLRIDQPFN